MPWSEEYLDLILLEDVRQLKQTSGFDDWRFNIKSGQWLSHSFSELAIHHGFPDIWIAGGGGINIVYFVGFWCGKDDDLICIAPLSYKKTKDLEPYLSPEGKTPTDAIMKTIRKRRQLRSNSAQNSPRF